MALGLAESTPVDDAAFESFDREVGAAMGLHNAVAARLVAVVGRCITDRWWEVAGTHSPEHWCKVRLGVAPATAARLVRCAEVLTDYPAVAAAFDEGQLSLDHVDVVVTMRPHPRFDRELADSARVWDIPRMKRIIRNFTEPPEPENEAEQDGGEDGDAPVGDGPPPDVVRIGWGDDGRYRGSFDLGPSLGAQFEKALGIARGALFTERTGVAADDDDREREPAIVSMPDALSRLLHHAATDGDRGSRPGLPRHRLRSTGVRPRPPRRSRAERRGDPASNALCPAGEAGRTNLRRGDVTYPRRSFVHWELRGPTDPDNLCCLCPEHHRMVHAGRLRVVGDPERPDGLVTLDHRGRPLPQPGPLPPFEPLPAAPAAYLGTYWGQRAHFD